METDIGIMKLSANNARNLQNVLTQISDIAGIGLTAVLHLQTIGEKNDFQIRAKQTKCNRLL